MADTAKNMQFSKTISLYQELLLKHGPQGWWPIKGKYHPNNFDIPANEEEMFEIIIGAILTQNASWKNVEKALNNLYEKEILSPEKIIEIDMNLLAESIKPAGYYNQKAKKLKIIAEFLQKNSIKQLKMIETQKLREILRSIWGIGPETADSILLYAFKRPVFVIDAYTKRIAKQRKIADEIICNDYSGLQKLITNNLEMPNMRDYEKIRLFNEFHALIVEEGKNNTFKNKKGNNSI